MTRLKRLSKLTQPEDHNASRPALCRTLVVAKQGVDNYGRSVARVGYWRQRGNIQLGERSAAAEGRYRESGQPRTFALGWKKRRGYKFKRLRLCPKGQRTGRAVDVFISDV